MGDWQQVEDFQKNYILLNRGWIKLEYLNEVLMNNNEKLHRNFKKSLTAFFLCISFGVLAQNDSKTPAKTGSNLSIFTFLPNLVTSKASMEHKDHSSSAHSTPKHRHRGTPRITPQSTSHKSAKKLPIQRELNNFTSIIVDSSLVLTLKKDTKNYITFGEQEENVQGITATVKNSVLRITQRAHSCELEALCAILSYVQPLSSITLKGKSSVLIPKGVTTNFSENFSLTQEGESMFFCDIVLAQQNSKSLIKVSLKDKSKARFEDDIRVQQAQFIQKGESYLRARGDISGTLNFNAQDKSIACLEFLKAKNIEMEIHGAAKVTVWGSNIKINAYKDSLTGSTPYIVCKTPPNALVSQNTSDIDICRINCEDDEKSIRQEK